jgi:hypothetical protein
MDSDIPSHGHAGTRKRGQHLPCTGNVGYALEQDTSSLLNFKKA